MTATFLINLDRSIDRLAFMQQQFDRLGMTVIRIAAIEGAAVPEWLAAEFSGPHRLMSGEVGCYASHLIVAQRIVGEGLGWAIVLEDDATLDDDFMEVALDAVAKVPPEWDYLHLCSHFKRSVIGVADLVGGHSLIRYERQPCSTAAYAVSNAGARKWLNPMPRVRPNDIDNRYAWIQGLNVYGVYPEPARQMNNFESDVGHVPSRRDERNWAPSAHADLYSHLWTMRQIGVSTYVKARALNAWNSARRRIDGKRRVAIL